MEFGEACTVDPTLVVVFWRGRKEEPGVGQFGSMHDHTVKFIGEDRCLPDRSSVETEIAGIFHSTSKSGISRHCSLIYPLFAAVHGSLNPAERSESFSTLPTAGSPEDFKVNRIRSSITSKLTTPASSPLSVQINNCHPASNREFNLWGNYILSVVSYICDA